MYKEFKPGDWCFDRYAKTCERCDTIIGRYGVMVDEQGFRQVLWWPHQEWCGVEGSFLCLQHVVIPQEWRRLF